MKLTKLGICGIISLLSYTAKVVFSPLVYPGYDWLSMAVRAKVAKEWSELNGVEITPRNDKLRRLQTYRSEDAFLPVFVSDQAMRIGQECLR